MAAPLNMSRGSDSPEGTDAASHQDKMHGQVSYHQSSLLLTPRLIPGTRLCVRHTEGSAAYNPHIQHTFFGRRPSTRYHKSSGQKRNPKHNATPRTVCSRAEGGTCLPGCGCYRMSCVTSAVLLWSFARPCARATGPGHAPRGDFTRQLYSIITVKTQAGCSASGSMPIARDQISTVIVISVAGRATQAQLTLECILSDLL